MGLRDQPHYRIDSAELAAWLVKQGADRWWSVDGDYFLSGRMPMPCTAEDLAKELRRIHRPLLVEDRRDPPLGHGELITAADLDALVVRLGDFIEIKKGPRPIGSDDRELSLCWEDRGEEWLLLEDGETTEAERRDALQAEGN